MKERWLPIGVLAGALFAVNVVARLVTRFGFDDADQPTERVSWAMFAVIGVILAVVAFIRGRREPAARWGADVAAAVLVALLLTIFVGPLLVGNNPFAVGGDTFFAQIGFYVAATGVGTLFGYLVLTALGLDHRSRSLKRYAEVKSSKPRRVIRR